MRVPDRADRAEDRIRCLLVEDGSGLRAPVTQALAASGSDFRLHTASRGEAADALASDPADIVLLAVPEPLAHARAVVRDMVQAAAGAPVIAIGRLPEHEAAIDLLRQGAQDYLLDRPAVIGALPRILRHAVERGRLAERSARAVSHGKDLESLLKAVISVTETPLLIVDDAGRTVAASPGFMMAFGWSSGTAGLPHLDQLVSAREDVEAESEGQSVRVRCGDGEFLPARERTAVTSMEGRPWRIVSLTRTTTPDETAVTAARLLAGMAGREGSFLAGRLQLVGLHEIRERLGSDWERWSERAYGIAEKVIRARIADHDVFARNKVGDFIVCFSSLGGEDARYKAQAIAREIREKLIGDTAEGELAEFRLEAHSVAVTESELAEEPDIAALLSKKLDQAAERIRNDRARLLRQAYEQAMLVPERVYLADGAHAPAVTARLDPETEFRLEELRSAASDDQLLTEIDLLILDRSIDYIGSRLQGGDRRILIVPLHYATLHGQRSRETYVRMCRKLPETVRNAIGLSVREIPEHAHPGRICDLVAQMRSFARMRMLHLRRVDLQGINLRDAGVSVVALTYPGLASVLRSRPASLDALVREIRLQGGRFAVTCVPDAGAARTAAEHGAAMLTFDPYRSR